MSRSRGPFGTPTRLGRGLMLSMPGRRGVPLIPRVPRAVAVCASVTAATEAPRAPSDDKRWKIVETRMRRLGNQPDALVEALHSAQEAFGYLDGDALTYVGRTLVGAALDGVRRRDVLPLLHAQAGRRAHRGRVHRDRVLHQRRERDPGRHPRRAGHRAEGDDGRREGVAADGALPRRLQPRARRDRRRRGRGTGRRAGARRHGWTRCDRRTHAPAGRGAGACPGRAAATRAPGDRPRAPRARARLRLRLRGGQLPVHRVPGRPRGARRTGHRRRAWPTSR